MRTTHSIHSSENQAPNSQVVHAIRISRGDLPLGIAKFQQPSSVNLLTFSHLWSSKYFRWTFKHLRIDFYQVCWCVLSSNIAWALLITRCEFENFIFTADSFCVSPIHGISLPWRWNLEKKREENVQSLNLVSDWTHFRCEIYMGKYFGVVLQCLCSPKDFFCYWFWNPVPGANHRETCQAMASPCR